MATARPAVPSGHGEVLASPPFEEWRSLAEQTAERASRWTFDVGGLTGAEFRACAREEALSAARSFSERLGVAIPPARDVPLLAVTGHQPELYHPGVWIKDFLLQRFADSAGAAAIDLVVDSDGFDAVELAVPCMKPEVTVCREYLAIGSPDGCYACAPVPSGEEIDAFCRGAGRTLATLSAPAVLRHFDSFCDALRSAAGDAGNLGELVTFARRRYEDVARTDYLELPVTVLAGARTFARFVAHIALDAERFASAYNAELAAYRAENRVRSAVQPFPDLEAREGIVELPFWTLSGGRRKTLSVRSATRGLLADGEPLLSLPDGAGAAADTLSAERVPLAPKALALTTYARMFLADLFIHGVGGGRYDRVADGLVRRFFGVEPPRFAVASMTMYLPLGARLVEDAEVERVTAALHALEHNPDRSLGEIGFDSAEEHDRAVALAEEKASLVEAIARPGADKKALGGRIREVNAELAAMFEPLAASLREERERLLALRRASDILTDRTYPFCLWSPLEVQDKAG